MKLLAPRSLRGLRPGASSWLSPQGWPRGPWGCLEASGIPWVPSDSTRLPGAAGTTSDCGCIRLGKKQNQVLGGLQTLPRDLHGLEGLGLS